MKVEACIIASRRLSEEDREAMFRLHGAHFCNVVRGTFMDDLAQKDWVILMKCQSEIVGFSTIQILRLPAEGRDRVFLFSGDTVVDRAFWQRSALAGAFGHFMLRLMATEPGRPIHWFLISKGYRTYRFLPVFFRRFFPVHHSPTPPEETAVLDAVARFKFGSAYDPARGIISFGGTRDRLSEALAEVPPHRRRDPHVAFFLRKNPGYRSGDELACLADISKENLNESAWRVIRHTDVTWHE
jgi:hypothetical protein